MKRILILLLVSTLILAAAGPVLAGQRPPAVQRAAVGRAAPLARIEAGSGGSSIYLPLIMRRYTQGFDSPFGVAFYYGIDNPAGLGQIKETGARTTSTYFRWRQIEPNAPISGTHTYIWTEFDTKVANAHAAGISVYTMFSWNPAWAAALPGGPVTNTQNLLDIVTAAAERYDGDGVLDAPGHLVVNQWAFYMEPDNYWLEASQVGDRGYWGHQPEAYADMLAQVANAMHGANPNAIIMPGAVAYDFFAPPDGNGSFKKDFLGRVIDRLNVLGGGNGAAVNYIDAVPFNYYPISPNLWSDIHLKAQEIRGIMAARGVGHLPLIVPEMGHWSGTTGPNDPPSSSPDQQARRLVQMYVHGMSEHIAQMNWFEVFDGPIPGLEEHGLFYGHDLNAPKPAYFAFGVLVNEMTGAEYVGTAHSAGIEGYLFSMWHAKNKWVVWATQPSANAAFPSGCLRRVDYMGSVATPITDGSAWDQDGVPGQITLQVLENQPLYVEGC